MSDTVVGGQYRARRIYLVGIFGWVVGWALIAVLSSRVFQFPLFINSSYVWLLLIPFFGGIVSLSINAKIWWNPRCFSDYTTEVNLVECIERHAHYMTLATSVILTMAVGLKVIETSVIWFMMLALSCAIIGVFPHYWIPCNVAEDLVRLRHVKTVPLLYSVYFFLSALIALSLSISAL